jgi:hypothetical protein
MPVHFRVAGRTNPWKHLLRDSHNVQHLIIPIKSFEVHEHCSGGICYIGNMSAALRPTSQPPDDPAVHVSKESIAFLCGFSDAGYIFKNPLDLGAREIGCKWQSYRLSEPILSAVFGECITNIFSSCVLPYDCVVVGLARPLVPNHGRFPLIRDTDSCNLVSRNAAFLQYALDNILTAFPDFHRVMFYPAWLWINLLMFQLMNGHHFASMVKNHEPGACRTLI